MHRHSWLVLLGVAVLGFFIAILADHDPSSLIFADSTSTFWTWGYNNHGQLGDGTITDKNTPTQEATGATSTASNWSAISAGDYYTVGLKSNGTLWAWGLNNHGQLGDGTTADKTWATQESTGATNWSAIATGGYHTVALKSDGTLWAWGHGRYGELGDGTTASKDVPTQESTGATNWTAIAAGGFHTVALKSDGTLWAWGNNEAGQLGDGSTTDKNTPIQPIHVSNEATSTASTASNWSSIAAGYYHTVALKSDGTLWAWGSNGKGSLGDGTTADKTWATQESTGATNWSAIVAGTAHTVALKSSGTQPTPTPIPTVSTWGLAALAAALLVMTAILLRRTSGHRPATTP